MAEPDYLICLECESPTYIFEWRDGSLVEAQCTVCGNDDPTLFATEEEMDDMALASSGDEGEEVEEAEEEA
jgi:translation initiation factor 2 beta subunit (eIF-2beta)/eIF-5